MKIDTKEHLTIDEAAKKLGINRRAVYRVIKRASDAGAAVVVKAFGKTLIVKSRVNELKKYYFPQGSEQRSEMAKEWGAMGGTQKRLNREANA